MVNKKFCYELDKIENYELAKSENFIGWVLHHRLETHFSNGELRPKHCNITVKELKSLDMYYNRPANELIFMRKSEHRKLHCLLDSNFKPQFGNQHTKGFHPSAESRAKMSKAAKNVVHTQEWNKKVGESQKKYWDNVSSEERANRAKIDSEAQKKWWAEHPEAKVKSEETRRRMSEAAKKREAAKRLAKARTQTQENCEE